MFELTISISSFLKIWVCRCLSPPNCPIPISSHYKNNMDKQ